MENLITKELINKILGVNCTMVKVVNDDIIYWYDTNLKDRVNIYKFAFLCKRLLLENYKFDIVEFCNNPIAEICYYYANLSKSITKTDPIDIIADEYHIAIIKATVSILKDLNEL